MIPTGAMGDGLGSLPDDIETLKAALIVARTEAAAAPAPAAIRRPGIDRRSWNRFLAIAASSLIAHDTVAAAGAAADWK